MMIIHLDTYSFFRYPQRMGLLRNSRYGRSRRPGLVRSGGGEKRRRLRLSKRRHKWNIIFRFERDRGRQRHNSVPISLVQRIFSMFGPAGRTQSPS